jgi:hypothetical protein
VHLVFGQILHPHRLEGARADVQRQRRALHAAGVEPREQASSKCRPAVGAATAPGFLRKHRLIAGFVGRVGIVLDVRRQRQAAELLDQRQTVVGEMQRVERLDAFADCHVEASARRIVVPGCGLLLARICASAVRSP